MSFEPEKLDIRIFDDADEHLVDAEVLARILQGVQRAVHIIAMDENKCDPASLHYVPKGIQDAFLVRCKVPQPGSYVMPMQIGNPHDLAAPQSAKDVVDLLTELLAALAMGEHVPYIEKIQNSRYRIPLLDAFRGMLPKPGATWKLGISRPNIKETTLSGETVRNITMFKERIRQHRTVTQTIAGYLQAMQFEARKITILYPENNRELECFYNEELEPDLVDNRRDLVQVTGTVVVDADNVPIKIQDVESIQPVDLSDFVVKEIDCGQVMLRFSTPLTLTPELTESKQYMTLQHEGLCIDIIAPTREELLEELHQQIAVLWNEYALEDNGNLTPKAIDLKERLKAEIQEAEKHG